MKSEIELYNEIGKKIKKRRKSLNITQEKLAEITNYSLSFIANIESNTYQSFSISALNNIAKALNTNMSNLLPTNYRIKKVNNFVKCENCDYFIEMPLEIGNILSSIEELCQKKLRFTCPKCHKKIK